MVVLLFDVCCRGFYRWVRRRLELLGYRVLVTRYRHDHHIAKEARRLGAIVVTYDKYFPYPHKIVLSQDRQYEEQATELIRALARGRRGDVSGH